MGYAQNRIQALQKAMLQMGLDAALIMDPENRRYISGFCGSTGYAVILSDSACFLADFRYTEQAKQQCPDCEVLAIQSVDGLFSLLREKGVKRLGTEESKMTLGFYKTLCLALPSIESVPVDDVLASLRMVKDENELAAVRRACEITDLAYAALLDKIRPGITESYIDRFLQDCFRSFSDVEKLAERFIVASGERGSMPHGLAGERVVCTGDMVTIDFGCNCAGYWSDVSRTFCVGKANEKQKEIYRVTLQAQETAIGQARPGTTGRALDTLARTVISDAGYGPCFGHNLGHSFGLGIHEAPQCAQNSCGDIVLKENMLITVEPGIYIPGFGGVRIEDDILITATGYENLTKASKELLEL